MAPVTANVPAVATLPLVSATVNLSVSHTIPPFALRAPVSEVEPVTANVPAVAILPLVSATVNLSVSHTIPPFALRAPVSVVIPVTANVLDKVVASDTDNVPAVATLPLVSATVNLLVSHAIPPFALRAPVSVVAPVTANVLDKVVASDTVNVPAVATLPLVSATVNLSVSHAITRCG